MNFSVYSGSAKIETLSKMITDNMIETIIEIVTT